MLFFLFLLPSLVLANAPSSIRPIPFILSQSSTDGVEQAGLGHGRKYRDEGVERQIPRQLRNGIVVIDAEYNGNGSGAAT